jgi:AcrR family transcriptional regulator
MTTDGRSRKDRIPLWRDRVLQTALTHADSAGLEGFTMRRLAQVLDVAPMALYRHVANKDDLLDGMIDLVFAEIELPAAGLPWETWMRQRAVSVRQALVRHPWATGLMESRRRPGPATLRHRDAVIGKLRGSGFSIDMAAHAYSVMDAYIYGFAMNQASLPSDPGMETAELASVMVERFSAEEYPHLAEFTYQHVMRPGYDFGDEFEFGLDLILGGLATAARSGSEGQTGATTVCKRAVRRVARTTRSSDATS